MHQSRKFTSRRHSERGLIELLTLLAVIGVVVALLFTVLMAHKRAEEASTWRAAQQPGVAAATPTSVTTNTLPSQLGAADKRPSFDEPQLLLLYFASSFAAIAWSYKQLLSSLRLRAELGILETLSDGKPRTRAQLARSARCIAFELRLIPGAVTDALASLAAKNRIAIKDSKYIITDSKAVSNDSARGC